MKLCYVMFLGIIFLSCLNFCEACQISDLIERNISQNFSKPQNLEQLDQMLKIRKDELKQTPSSDATLREYSRIVGLLELVEQIKLFDKSQDGSYNSNSDKDRLLCLSSLYEEDVEDAAYNHVNKIFHDSEKATEEEW